MRFINFQKLLYIITIFTLFSCGSTKNIHGNETEEMNTVVFLKKADTQKPVFRHLTIQSKIDVDIDDTKASLNGKIYIENKEKIWVNVSKFGLTAARALITPNGFQAYEKLNRTYIDGDFEYFNNLLKVDFIDYQKLQNLLLGRLFTEINPKDFELKLDGNWYLLFYKKNDELLNQPKAGKYIQKYVFDNNFRLISAEIIDSASKMELLIEYTNWKPLGPQYFPGNVKVLVKDKKTQKVELEYNKFTFEESSTPFEIPSDYTPNDILKDILK